MSIFIRWLLNIEAVGKTGVSIKMQFFFDYINIFILLFKNVKIHRNNVCHWRTNKLKKPVKKPLGIFISFKAKGNNNKAFYFYVSNAFLSQPPSTHRFFFNFSFYGFFMNLSCVINTSKQQFVKHIEPSPTRIEQEVPSTPPICLPISQPTTIHL